VASLSQGRTAAAQCGLFTHKSVPVIFEPPCTWLIMEYAQQQSFHPVVKTLSRKSTVVHHLSNDTAEEISLHLNP